MGLKQVSGCLLNHTLCTLDQCQINEFSMSLSFLLPLLLMVLDRRGPD